LKTWANLKCSLAAILLTAGFSLSSSAAIEQEAVYEDGKNELQRLCTESLGWTDYSCFSEMHNFKPGKTTISASRFFYKKGPTVRLEVVGGGFRDGSVIVRGRDGKITARGGGLMGAIKMNLDPDSRMLILPSGVNVTHADFPELYLYWKDQVEHGCTCRLSAPMNHSEFEKKIRMMELLDAKNTVLYRVYLSAEERVPIRWDSYKADGGKTQTWFKNLKINAGLSDDLFKL
jgi:hypothetical protein